ncbi:hypothetical protein RN001_012850 [Aquatica leii]|uniref:Rho guanine nucleotide exchange factor 26 n=1 Tax=Aquatica leii TaxID=1421715 RepID=A0AAN7P5X6_9COLE|nr:hypothetical protein RN001_012850 [Aquatica leii]
MKVIAGTSLIWTEIIAMRELQEVERETPVEDTMSAQVNVNWSKSYSLDRHLTSAVYRGFVDLQPTPKAFHNFAPPYLQSEKIKSYQNSNNIESVPPNSFLHTLRLRRNLEESRKAFLNFCETKDDENELPDVNKENFEQKKAPTRKISFKCKKTPTYRRSTVGSNKIGTLNPNTVADLTLKFNELSEKVSILEQPKFARLVRRVNSLKTAVHEEGVNKKVVRKPSVKIKPVQTVEELNKVKLRNLKNLINVNSDLSVNVKTEAIDAATAVHAQKVQQQGMNVRATIEIFERRSSQSCTPEAEYKSIVKGVEKPKVPEKSPNIKTKDLVVKNGIKKLKKLDSTETTSSNESNITKVNEIKTELEDEVQILNIPLVMPRRCDSMYETLTLRRISPIPPLIITESKSESTIAINSYTPVKPNSSFLWRQKSQEMQNSESYDWKSTYDTVETTMVTEKLIPPAIPPRPTVLNLSKSPKLIFKKKMPLPTEIEEKIYEELSANVVNGSTDGDYEYCQSQSKYEDIEHKSDDGYECFDSVVSTPKTTKTEEIYETLPYNNKEQLKVPPRKQGEPLPPRPASRNSYCTIQNSENISNCYESIYNIKCEESISNNYESIYACNTHNEHWDSASNRDSMISSDQQSNSLYSRSLSGWTTEEVYNGKATSDLSGSDKSDEWIDISDNEENSKGTSSFVIVREKTRNKKTAGWSQKIRDQWNKSHSLEEDNSDSDHHYESLYNGEEYRDNECFDSFDSDTESENSFSKNQNDSGVDMCNSQLPDPPSQSYGLTRLAVSAGKHMKKLRRNWSLTKNDITKSLTRMAKRKSRTDLTNDAMTKSREDNNASPASTKPQISSPIMCERNSAMLNVAQEFKLRQSDANNVYQNVQYTGKDNTELTENYEKVRTSSLSKSKFLNKFRRSMLISTESANEITQSLGNKTKSTFYLTDPIDVDGQMDVTKSKGDSINSSVSPSLLRHSKSFPQRPQSPPPPVPVDANQNIDSNSARSTKRSTSWYAECGLFRNSETNLLRNSENSNSLNGRRPNTSWYAEIGLYQTSTSTPSSSSAENSGSAININVKPSESINSTENKDIEVKSESDYYNDSIGSCNSNTIIEKDSNISPDIQLRLQDEPLYQFYDAAVLESVCHDGTSDFDYDGYEEVGEKLHLETNLTRPSAMQLISPSKNGFTVVRTLWCEIPEVINSTVLSTLSLHQKKIQEAKFEMITSEASYLNSLNVLTDYFITNLNNSDLITNEEKTLLFSRIPAVKRCSEKLLIDLEKCWQGNILLHGICDIVKKHAEEHFDVYISYCENQILLDSTLRKMRERNSCSELLKQLECSSACQSLTLYSFLMLPMQRITRWPLLVDAVLKRLSPQDDEYLTCQCTLAAINKVVTQCNEAARLMERETEVKKIASQIEFPRGIPSIKVASNSRWLVRSGVLTQMLARADDTKLTFGKRFSKVPLHLFLFNDLLLVTKHRSDDCYIVLHYCFRSYVELNESDVIGSFPIKDSQGRHLLFLTILENHDGKTVEMLLSCNSESDKERWIEALTPPKSEDPDETLYECWDCPQVTAIHSYNASQPDELALSRGDVINVIRKMADGWYHGERIRDGQTGWFPANYTIEIANPHVRARNLKQRYRLLALSGNYLKSK